MKNWRLIATMVGAMAAASLAASCGDNSATCGEGTTLEDGVCVPDGSCGPGTVLVDDECVPDGSVICEQGTVYDEAAGGCVPSEDACAEGTVLVDGQCVNEDDARDADHEEASEPNDGLEATDDIAGMFDVPAVGDPGVTFHGCITPYRDLDTNGQDDVDYDMWLITADGPSLIEVTADGVHGLSAAFIAIPGTQDALIDNGWQRYGLNLTGDTAQRQIYLPEAGLYAILVTDGRSLFLTEGAAGSEETCYFGTVANVAIPTPTPATPNTEIAGSFTGETMFYSADPADGSFFIGVSTEESDAAVGTLMALKNDAVFEYNAGDAQSVTRTGGLANADEVVYVVEAEYNYAISPVPFTLQVIAPTAAQLPLDGDLPVTNIGGDDVVAWFDVTANNMHHFDISSAEELELVFINDHGQLITAQTTDFADWIAFPAPGRYHVVIYTDETTPATFTATSAISTAPIGTLPANGMVEDVAFNDLGSAWLRFDPGSEIWLSFAAGATNWGSDVSLDFYDLAGAVGVPEDDFGAAFFMDVPADGSDVAGHIFLGETRDFLVQVRDFNGTADGTSTFDLITADRDFTDLGTVTEAAPHSTDGIGIDPGVSKLYLVRAAHGDTVTVTADPSTLIDVRLEFLNANEGATATSDTPVVDTAESIERIVLNPTTWIAFRVTNDSLVAGTFDLDVTVVSPVPYSAASGSITFTDICEDANADDITPADDDEGLTPTQTLPFSFDLFGEDAGTDYVVSTNGWVAFGAVTNAAAGNVALPATANPNGVVAPYWNDLWQMTVCRLDEATMTTIQFSGDDYWSAGPVQFQVRFHDSGVIDYVYGPGHTASGLGDQFFDAGATVGLENLGGYFGNTYFHNGTGFAPGPSSSTVLTPNP